MGQTPFTIRADEHIVIRGNVHVGEGNFSGTRPVLIFCHGFKGFKDWGSFPYVADQLADRGIVTIRFNFSHNGVGESETEFDELDKFAINTYARELADLELLLDAWNAGTLPLPENADRTQVFLMGHSKGGGDAILFGAGHRQVKGIITWNGIAQVNLFDAKLRQEIAEKGVGYIANARTGQQMPISRAVIEDVDQNQQAYDLIAKVREMPQPLLIVQGDKDFARLVEGAKRLHEADADSELHWIADGDHVFNTRHPFSGSSPQLEEALDATARFVTENSRP